MRGGKNSGATFNIGTQNAANINNIGGDAVIEGGVHASANIETHELRVSIAHARELAAGLDLPRDLGAVVDRALTSAADEAAGDQPDERRIAEHLGKAGRALREAGSAASGVTAVIQALRHAAGLLGPLAPLALALI